MLILFIIFTFSSIANSILNNDRYTFYHNNKELNTKLTYQDKINSINANKDLNWKAGVNIKFESATLADLKNHLGNKYLSKEDLKKNDIEIINNKTFYHKQINLLNKIKGLDSLNIELPKSYNASETYPNCKSISHIQDQSYCGSCWANAASGVMSDRLCIHSENKESKILLSTNNILSCCNMCGNGCEGGFTPKAFRYWGYKGVVTGGDYMSLDNCQPYPFEPCNHHVSGSYKECKDLGILVTPICNNYCQNSYQIHNYNDDKLYGSAYSVIGDEELIKTDIYLNGPVSAGYIVYDDFVLYKSGVYSRSPGSNPVGGHAVRIIGWGEEEINDKTVPYWLVANSWNKEWGLNGFFKILRGSNECNIEDDINAGIPSKSNKTYNNKFNKFIEYIE